MQDEDLAQGPRDPVDADDGLRTEVFTLLEMGKIALDIARRDMGVVESEP